MHFTLGVCRWELDWRFFLNSVHDLATWRYTRSMRLSWARPSPNGNYHFSHSLHSLPWHRLRSVQRAECSLARLAQQENAKKNWVKIQNRYTGTICIIRNTGNSITSMSRWKWERKLSLYQANSATTSRNRTCWIWTLSDPLPWILMTLNVSQMVRQFSSSFRFRRWSHQ